MASPYLLIDSPHFTGEAVSGAIFTASVFVATSWGGVNVYSVTATLIIGGANLAWAIYRALKADRQNADREYKEFQRGYLMGQRDASTGNYHSAPTRRLDE